MTTANPAPVHGEEYRPDIDGLRAVAILAVIGFHGFPRVLPGGFIGVDIFFVISGYLISRIIFNAVDAGTFEFSDFYGRRIRRIFPALSIVLLACLVAGYVLSFPDVLAALGLHVAAGALFLSNVMLWTESGYFDADSATKPLLHLWSLGIEEQFYLLWPVLILLIGRNCRNRLLALLLIMGCSFTLNILLVASHPVSAFYLPMTRFWELLVGATLSYLTQGRCLAPSSRWSAWMDAIRGRQYVGTLVGLTGAAAIGLGLLLLRDTDPFPGWRALLPTLGAALLILAGPASWVNRRILRSRVAVAIGLISYPLYLWHWPMLVFPSGALGGLPRTLRIVSVTASILLAWLTYTIIEKPVRRARNRSRLTMGLTVGMAMLGAVGFAVHSSQGLPQRYPLALRQVALADQQFDYAAYREGRCFLQPTQAAGDFAAECVGPPEGAGQRLVVLWGDSHAASLYPGLRSLIARQGLPLRLAQFTAAACPPVVDFQMAKRPNCRAENDATLRFIEREKPDAVILLAAWSFYSGKEYELLEMSRIKATIARIRAAGVQNIVLVGPLPRWLEHQPNVALREWNSTHSVVTRSKLNFDQSVVETDGAMRDALGGVAQYVSPLESLCDRQGCQILVRDADAWWPVAWDDAHLTQPGSELVGRLVLSHIP
jgi:peptidoglycan/LPS O-acetylase OafA/YrhL